MKPFGKTGHKMGTSQKETFGNVFSDNYYKN
jgi:hypothetical protein